MYGLPPGQISNNAKTGCRFCPDGTVRGNATGTLSSGCVNVTTTIPNLCTRPGQLARYGRCQTCPSDRVPNALKSVCEYCPVWQFVSSGTCRDCSAGQVANANKTGCTSCPSGTVRGNSTGTMQSGCVNVTTANPSPCPNAWQQALNGRCQTCPTGQVGNALKSACNVCPSGTVRGANGTDLSEPGGCVNVTTADPSPCPNAWQYALNGRCQTCPTGQVGNALKSACNVCPSGTVRGANGTDLSEPGGCVNVTTADPSPCPNAWQYALNGRCQICPTAGTVGNALKTDCVYCPFGTVRGANGTELSGCVNVTTADPSPCPNAWQYAQFGTCRTCPTAGTVGNALKTDCVYCPFGTVRGANGTELSGCVNVTTANPSPCPNAWQYAQYGTCRTCPVGQVGNALKNDCEFCPFGTARGANGTDLSEPGGCVNVTSANPSPCPNAWQYAQYGRCYTCVAGQVGNALKSGCEFCAAGTVRGENGTSNSGCDAAGVVCLSSQIGISGRCQSCSIGQVPNVNRTGCRLLAP